MSITPMDVERTLVELAARIENGQRVVHKADVAWTEAQREYELAMAHALLRAEGPNAEARKAVAVLATREERIRMDVAGLALRDAQGLLRSLTAVADLWRSVGSSVRASMAVA